MIGNRITLCAFLFLVVIGVSADVHGYRMPEYRISQGDWVRPAEDVFQNYNQQMDEIESVMPRARLESQRSCHKCRLGAGERKAYREYLDIKTPYDFWKYVVDFKKDLIPMTDAGKGARDEADVLAKTVIEKLYELSNEYKIVGSALMQNVLINTGIKRGGFCYHYVDALRKVIAKKQWNFFEIHWGAAYDQTFLENNGLVITAKGRPFMSGIVVDAWRTASKPYWNRVKGDRFPWKELNNVEIVYENH